MPVTPFSIICSKAPTLLATVGTLTNAASTHLFSDFASLNMLFSKGARLMSTDAIF